MLFQISAAHIGFRPPGLTSMLINDAIISFPLLTSSCVRLWLLKFPERRIPTCSQYCFFSIGLLYKYHLRISLFFWKACVVSPNVTVKVFEGLKVNCHLLLYSSILLIILCRPLTQGEINAKSTATVTLLICLIDSTITPHPILSTDSEMSLLKHM